MLLLVAVVQVSSVSRPVGLAARAAAAAADGLPVLTAAGAAPAAPTAALLLLRVSTAAAMSARPETGSSQPLLLLVCMARPPTGGETAAAPVAAGADLSLRVATILPLLLLAGNPGWPGSLLALLVLLLLGDRVRIAAAIASTAESLFAAGRSTGAAATLPVLLSAVGALLLLEAPDLGAATAAGAGAGAPAAMEGAFCRTAAAISATLLDVSMCLDAAPLLVGRWPKLLLTAPAAGPALLLLCCCALHAGAAVRTTSLPAAAAATAPGSGWGCCSCCLLSTAAANASTDEAVSDMRTCRPVLGSTVAVVAVAAVAAVAGRGRDPREARLLPAAVAPAAPPALSCCHSFFRSAATVRASDRPASPLLADSQACAAAQGSAGGGSHLGRTLPSIPPLAAVPVLVVLLVLLTLLLRDSGRACSFTCSCSTSCCCLRQKDN